MEDNKNLEPNIDPEVNMGAHDPKIDLARNKNLFKKSLYTAGAFVLILVIICTWNFCSSQSYKNKMSQADYAMSTATDSLSQAQANEMYAQLAESNSTPAQRAKIISAGNAYTAGDYQKALDFIKDVNTKSPVVMALKYCLEGDCYVNLDKVDDGIKAFRNAVDEADGNPEIAPYALTKLANAYRFKGDYKNELETLREIMKEFPSYNRLIESEIARAEAMAK